MNTKNSQNELPTSYAPESVEKKHYEIWETLGYFKPREGKQKQTYCIIMPPPNVTGRLHEGHALDITTQDTIIRYKRMKGFKTLYLPGMDHAGIATQSAVEKFLSKTEHKKKCDYTREEFLKKIWAWKEEYGGIILSQQKMMGASPDWSYFLFTMDPHANLAVRTFFTDMFNKGLIYKSDYIVNWDPILQSALSDEEVEHKEVKGAFYHLLYPVIGENITLEIATTRPETMLGDSAVAVHPKDERYAHLVGKKVLLPISSREIPIIADEYVDREFGTGCLKVTPGHDFNDFEIGKRHNLKFINILNKDATLNNEYGLKYKGLSVKAAREEIIKDLKEQGVLVKIVEHVHQVGHGDRSSAVIEPMISKQWFLKVSDLAQKADEAVKNDTTRFYPKSWENTYFSWMKNTRDWCISRQLWWGHQIPVFYCADCSNIWASKEEKQTECPKCKSKKINQDPDVLDTWFSSGLWPLTTLGWPDEKLMKGKGFDEFYPTSTLVTGFDIIFFWVARMMMMGIEAKEEVPFKKVYIHAIVRDKLGKKISKSLGNGINPIETIKKYGADAFRFTLATGSGYNRTLNLDPEKIEAYRNFINKIWNAFRFIHPFLTLAKKDLSLVDDLSHHEKWILSELEATTNQMNLSFDEFRFDEASSAIYSFTYSKFCSWFIELSKNILYSGTDLQKETRATVLKYCFKKMLALLHPITPFITEELWTYLKDESEDLLIITSYPESSGSDLYKEDLEFMNMFIETVTLLRSLRANVNLKPKDEIDCILFTDHPNLKKYYENHFQDFKDLARVKGLKVYSKNKERPEKSVMLASSHTEVFLPLENLIDLNVHIEKIKKEILKTEDDLMKNNKKLENKQFMKNAPEHIREEVSKKASDLNEKLKSLKENLKTFQG